MPDTIAQLGLLAQGSDFEDWQSLLVLLVMGALWLVGVLAKAFNARRATRQNEQNDPTRQPARPRETWQERLARKVEEIQRAAGANSTEMARRQEQKTGSPAGGREPPRARAPSGKITIRQGPRGESVMVYERPEPPPAVPSKPQPAPPQRPRQAVAVGVRVPTSKPLPVPSKKESDSPAKPIAAGLSSVALEPSQSSGPAEPDADKREPAPGSADFEPPAIIDYRDPDALQKAILHYEIFGKPLAFRDLFE